MLDCYSQNVLPQVGDPDMLRVACAEMIRDVQDALQTLQLLTVRLNLRHCASRLVNVPSSALVSGLGLRGLSPEPQTLSPP